jgi:hypothetical protein
MPNACLVEARVVMRIHTLDASGTVPLKEFHSSNLELIASYRELKFAAHLDE